MILEILLPKNLAIILVFFVQNSASFRKIWIITLDLKKKPISGRKMVKIVIITYIDIKIYIQTLKN
jgi:hypothetical protein